MAAAVAFGNAIDGNVADLISSFLYRSPSVISTCGTNASDIANLSDLDDYLIRIIAVRRKSPLYHGSMEWELPCPI